MPHNLSFLLSSFVCTPLSVSLSIIAGKMKMSTARKLLLGASSFFRSRYAPFSLNPLLGWELSRYQSQSCANGACVRTPKSDGRLSKNLTSNQKNSSYLQHTCLFHVSMASFREIQYLLTGLFPIV